MYSPYVRLKSRGEEEKMEKVNKKVNREFIKKAFFFSKESHEGQFRVSEEPYIIHPMEVVKILISLRADKHTLMAGFLHDVLEDTDTPPEEIKEKFGEDVLNLEITRIKRLYKNVKEHEDER